MQSWRRWRDQRYSVSSISLLAAWTKAYRKLAELERPDYREPKPLKEAIDAFKAAKEDVGHGTKRNHRRVLDKFLAITRAESITRLDDVEIETIDLFARSARSLR